jgi:hypothetical protein
LAERRPPIFHEKKFAYALPVYKKCIIMEIETANPAVGKGAPEKPECIFTEVGEWTKISAKSSTLRGVCRAIF